MHNCTNGSATLPRDFRSRNHDSLSTPEPDLRNELKQPPPPKHRLRIRRRAISQFQPPTDQFLASVAAADVPLPTIEVPQILPSRVRPAEITDFEAELQKTPTRDRSPKTPVPTLHVDTNNVRKPDWYRSNTSENSIHRPSSSHSEDSNLSHESFDSCCRNKKYYESDDGDCTSPEPEFQDPYHFSTINEAKSSNDKTPVQVKVISMELHSRKKRRYNFPWTRAQISHLWSTYLVYLQDPTLTPLRIGKSRVPPEGVCHRVARVARKSWKVPQGLGSSVSRDFITQSKNKPTTSFDRCLSVYAQWPHSSSATRSKLRDLCRQKDQNYAYRFQHYFQAFGTTPFSKSMPSQCALEFTATEPMNNNMNINDISISLSMCTAESMHSDGPLVKLAGDASIDNYQNPLSASTLQSSRLRCITQNRSRRLGSPFSRSYGPSSSKVHERPSVPYVGSLGSPLKIAQTRSLSGVQKRRAQHALNEELNLNDELHENLFWGQPSYSRHGRTRGFSLGDQINITQDTFSYLVTNPLQRSPNQTLNSNLFAATTNDRPRLRSPFMESGICNTTPRRPFPVLSPTERMSSQS